MFFIVGYIPDGKFIHIEDMDKAFSHKKILIMALHKTLEVRLVTKLLGCLNKDDSNADIYSTICQHSARLFFKTSCARFAVMARNPSKVEQYRQFYGERELYTVEFAKMVLETPSKWPEQKPRLSIQVEPDEPKRQIQTYELNSNGMVVYNAWQELPNCAGIKSPPFQGPKRFVFPMEISN